MMTQTSKQILTMRAFVLPYVALVEPELRRAPA